MAIVIAYRVPAAHVHHFYYHGRCNLIHVQKWSDTEIKLRTSNPCTTVNGAASLTIAMVGEIRETGHSTSTRTDITDVPMDPQCKGSRYGQEVARTTADGCSVCPSRASAHD